MTNHSKDIAGSELSDTRNQPKHNSMIDGSIVGEIQQLVSGLVSARLRRYKEELGRKEYIALRNKTYNQIEALIQNHDTEKKQQLLAALPEKPYRLEGSGGTGIESKSWKVYEQPASSIIDQFTKAVEKVYEAAMPDTPTKDKEE